MSHWKRAQVGIYRSLKSKHIEAVVRYDGHYTGSVVVAGEVIIVGSYLTTLLGAQGICDAWCDGYTKGVAAATAVAVGAAIKEKS